MQKFLHALNSAEGMNYQALSLLWRHFCDWRYTWEQATYSEFIAAGLTAQLTEKICSGRKIFDVERSFADLWASDIFVIDRGHMEFPPLLARIHDPPFLLYRKGAPLDCTSRHIAIVGTRNSTTYGEKFTRELAEAIALQGGIVVSGLAFGIDAMAHFGAVTQKKPTVAVLASGLLEVTPRSHRSLADKILSESGTLISEYPPGKPAYPGNFLARNRIISGISVATIVTEAGLRSGALTTAARALEQNRDIYALPGDITRSQAQGCLRLIAEGAYPIVSIDNVLEQLGFKKRSASSASFTIEEHLIMQQLLQNPASTDDLLAKTGMALQNILLSLSSLELKGVISKNKAFLWEAADFGHE